MLPNTLAMGPTVRVNSILHSIRVFPGYKLGCIEGGIFVFPQYFKVSTTHTISFIRYFHACFIAACFIEN